MADLYEKYGIAPPNKSKGIDLYEKHGFQPSNRAQDTDWKSKAMSGVTGFNTNAGNVFHGILQPLLESGYLGKNISDSSKRVASERNREYAQEYEKNPLSTQLGGFAGDVTAFLPAGAGSGGVIRAIAPKLSPAIASVLSGIIGGGASGGAQYIQPGESRGSNILSGATLGGGLGLIPGAAAGVKSLAGVAKNIYKGRTPSVIAKRVIDDKKSIENLYKTKYKDFFTEAKNSGVTNVEVPKLKTKSLIKSAEKSETKALRKFLIKPTLENAHVAKSDLGGLVRALQKSKKTRGLNSDERIALSSAKKARDKINEAMSKALNEKGKGNLSEKYKEISSGYGKEVIPYNRSSVVNKYLSNELTDSDFVKALGTNKIAKKQLLDKYPEIKASSIAKKALINLGGATGVGYLLNKLFGGTE